MFNWTSPNEAERRRSTALQIQQVQLAAYPKGIEHFVSNPKPLAERAAGKKKRVKCGGRLVRQTTAGSGSGIKNFFSSAGNGA